MKGFDSILQHRVFWQIALLHYRIKVSKVCRGLNLDPKSKNTKSGLLQLLKRICKWSIPFWSFCGYILFISSVFLYFLTEETKQVLRLSLTEFSLPKFYLLFGISKVKSAAVIAFRSSYRDRSFPPGSYERETFALSSLETVTEALLEIMEVCVQLNPTWFNLWSVF